MTTNQLRTYRFETRAQWDKCLFVQADRSSESKSDVVRPFSPYGVPATRYESNGAHAPVVTRAGEIIWLDADGLLHRLSPCNDTPEVLEPPRAIVSASRIVATWQGLWVMSGSPLNSLELYESDSFSRLLTVDLHNVQLVDIASGGRDSVLALVKENDVWKSLSFDCAGHLTQSIEFQGLSHAKAFVFLKRSQRFVILTAGPQPKLEWFAVKDQPAAAEKTKKRQQKQLIAVRLFSRVVAAMRPCFHAEKNVLGSDSRERVFIAGKDGDHFAGGDYIVTLDSDGNQLGDVPVDSSDAPITGLTGDRRRLLATGKRGLLRFTASDVVPEGSKPVRTTLITPMLFSPDREDKRQWVRIEATVRLPEGSTLEISYASADKPEDIDRLHDILNDKTMLPSERAERLLNESDLWKGRTTFQGSGSETQEPKTFSAKLFDEHDSNVVVSISLSAAIGAHLPVLSKLDVLYPGRTLMENLPAIYQAEETKPDSFLRALVGVLETTTQGIDDKIAAMGSLINPATAPAEWLDFIARWVGVPWDDGLTLDQKRSVLSHAAEITKGRGTRAGLEAFLASLISDGPSRRFRVTDATADFGFAVVGNESCGSRLPAMLGGLTQWERELDFSTVLGHLRLPCPGQLNDGVWQLSGNIRVDIAANPAERKALEPWILSLINQMVPLTARVKLRWVTEQSLRSNRLDGTMKIDPAPTPHLGTDAITSLARLPQRATRLSSSGPVTGTRLR